MRITASDLPDDRSGQRSTRGPRPPIDVSRLIEGLPPHSPEAEVSLLGSMILDPRVIADVLPLVSTPDDFFLPANAAVFAAILQVYERHQTGDLVEIAQVLRDSGALDDVGGPDYLATLASAVPTPANAPHYARVVSEKGRLRRLINAAGEIIFDAHNAGKLGPEGAREVLDRAEMLVFNIAQEDQRSDPQRLAELLDIEIQRLQDQDGRGITGLATHFHDLDRMLSGLQPGEMVILAARPSMGKTALALNLAEQMALASSPWSPRSEARVPVAFFSLEMTKSAVVQRLISGRSGVSSHTLRSGSLSMEHMAAIDSAYADLRSAPLLIDDTPAMTVLQLRARARRLVAQHDVRAVFIDYLQLLTAPGAARESRQVEVSTISRQIKALARELSVPVICLSQLNRASEQRQGNRPRMSDLRESGSIEQDADVVMLLHREDYYHTGDQAWLAENQDKQGVAEIIIAKQRNGPTGVVNLLWDDSITRFKDWDGRSDSGTYAPGADDFPPPTRPPSRGPAEAAPWDDDLPT